MAMHTGDLRLRIRPGDALVVHDPGLWAEMIRIGGLLEGKPHRWNHLTIFVRVDKAGTFWGAQGQPGGVSWYDIGGYLDDPETLCNVEQSKTDEQREGICTGASAMVAGHTPYDWPAIAEEVLKTIDPLYGLRRDEWGPGVPGHVICSSAYDWLLEHVGLVSPKPDRYAAPWDFAKLWMDRTWE